jgi:kynureninase
MASLPHPELERWRDEFPILSSHTYLNSCSLGALSRRSMGYLGEFQALWNSMGASAWYELWLGRLDELRGRVAELWNARPSEVALMPSVSGALSSIGSAIDFSRRDRVVVAELDFPTQVHQWLVKPGVEVVRVPSDDGIGIPADRWAEYVDERTALVVTGHVFYSSGYIQDVGRIAEIAHAAGALCIIDGYQAAGQIPVDPRALGVDAYLAGPLKWLLGGPGMAYLWVREERIAGLVPTIASWFGAKEQFEFRSDEFAFREDARRFELGTPALPTMYTALGGLEIILEVGMEAVRDRIAGLTTDLVEQLDEAGFRLRIAGEPSHRSGIVMVRLEGSVAAVRRLAERGFIADHRGPHVRVSPHFYNTAEENTRFVAALREVVKHP